MNERIEEQPYDDRHNTPPRPRPYAPEPMQFPTVEELSLLSDGQPNRVLYHEPAQFETLQGLTWTFAPGQKLMDLGRITPDAIESLHMVDLRVILAHLDSAARSIQDELNRRI